MRIFYLTTEFLWPQSHGGRIRSLSQLRLLASFPEVTEIALQSLSEEPVDEGDLARAHEAMPKLRVLPPIEHPIHLRGRPRALARVAWLRLSRNLPYVAGKWLSPALANAIRRELSARDYDLVYVDHLGMAVYLDVIRAICPGVRVVLEEHNVESDVFRQFADRQRSTVRRFAGTAEWRAARRFEARVLASASSVVAISAGDAQALHELSGQRPVVIPQVVSFERKGHPTPPAPHLCYVGSLSWHPNVLGLDWFFAEVWPEIRRSAPEITLTVAGSGLGAAEGELQVPANWRAEGAATVGYLPDLEPLYRRSSAMIAPILNGSGIRIKLLEAMRAGVPTVTTPLGAAGLEVEDRREVLIAPEPERFAAASVELCHDRDLQESLREAAYSYLERNHSHKAAQDAMRLALGLPSPAAVGALVN